MKKSVLLLAICLTITFSAKAQIFEIDGESESESNTRASSEALHTPGKFGSTQDSGPYSPLGGGAALLIGFGAAYLMAKRRKE